MGDFNAENLDILLVEDTVWVLLDKIDVPSYDFSLSQFFACRRPWNRPEKITAIARFGVISNYDLLYQQLKSEGVSLINSPQQHLIASELPHWYPLLEDLTPKSFWFSEPPNISVIEKLLGFPIFIKGSRQTSCHKAALAIIHTPEEYQRAIQVYKEDPILHWQEFVCREFIQLRSLSWENNGKIPPSFEFRTFWWRGFCVGTGQYWSNNYSWNTEEKTAALAVAQKAALRLNLPFVVIDIAQTIEGDWIVIECNDAQESGYAFVSPFTLWQNLIDEERKFVN